MERGIFKTRREFCTQGTKEDSHRLVLPLRHFLESAPVKSIRDRSIPCSLRSGSSWPRNQNRVIGDDNVAHTPSESTQARQPYFAGQTPAKTRLDHLDNGHRQPRRGGVGFPCSFNHAVTILICCHIESSARISSDGAENEHQFH